MLARMFSLIQLADFISYYPALLNGVDPTPIKLIEYLGMNYPRIKEIS
ncbi:MAG: hypothetical protein GY839_13805 [candidate division Zixibacteria bacterium]|nr:hypothetical protein [candidate division Zixibacteria bacterium]